MTELGNLALGVWTLNKLQWGAIRNTALIPYHRLILFQEFISLMLIQLEVDFHTDTVRI